MGGGFGEDRDRGKALPAEETERKQAQKECTERVVLKSFQILCRIKRESKRDYYKEQTGDIQYKYSSCFLLYFLNM